MISTDLKIETYRRAVAAGFIKLAPETLRRIQANDLPKKDVLATARVAAVQAAKKTADLIPFCHPLGLDKAGVEFEFKTDGIRITSEVLCIARTGVEMEALAAVSVAALTIYDMCKAVDKNMEINGIRLVEKDGGKSDFEPQLRSDFKAAVIVCSDRCAKGQAEDKTGKFLVETLRGYGVKEPSYHLLPDEEPKISQLLMDLCGQGVDLILTTGGTGLSPRDRTVEAVKSVIERELPGAMEASRSFGQRRTPYAMLSRGVAGQRGQTLIVTLPGSQAGVRESMAALYPYLFHAHKIMRQAPH
jgi:molybdenum cofactor biosynthesis protein MoaC